MSGIVESIEGGFFTPLLRDTMSGDNFIRRTTWRFDKRMHATIKTPIML